MTKIISIFLLLVGLSFFAVPAAQAEGDSLITPDKIIHACLNDGSGIWNLNINNQRPYDITGTVTQPCYTQPEVVRGRATGKNGQVITATLDVITANPNCCSFRSSWTYNNATRSGSYTWQQAPGPNPGCGSSGGPVSGSLVSCPPPVSITTVPAPSNPAW